jgi:dUTP pyrophosphatase
MTTPVPIGEPLRMVRLDPNAIIPKYHSELASGLDLAACLPRGKFSTDRFMLNHGAIALVPTGLAMAIPPGYEGQVRPRSGLSTKHGVTVPNAPGTIDADYRGEVFVALINLGPEPIEIHHGLRIAQLVIAPVAHVRIIEADSLDDTARGTGGFGSTGLS